MHSKFNHFELKWKIFWLQIFRFEDDDDLQRFVFLIFKIFETFSKTFFSLSHYLV